MKKFWLVISLLLIFLGTSCSTNLDIEDGKIKDFVSVFNGDEAYDLVDYGRCYIENTHYKAYKKVRDAHPNIPIVMTSRPKYHLTEDELQRLDVIRSTFARATLEGDKNVYFIDGRELILPEWYECATVDNCHPNDIGFACMAKKIGEVLNFALNNLR